MLTTIMYPRFVLLVLLICLCACQTAPNNDPVSISPSIESAPTVQYVETRIAGVQIGVTLPAQWQVDEFNGLVAAESPASPDGISMYVFVPELPDLAQGAIRDPNVALATLRHVTSLPTYVGANVTMTEPEAFMWDGYEAAYYLLRSSDGLLSMIIAIELRGTPRVVVINISLPAERADGLRERLPALLDGLTLNSARLTGSALETLPDPLPQPDRSGIFAPRN
jgi:hypothetical protein